MFCVLHVDALPAQCGTHLLLAAVCLLHQQGCAALLLQYATGGLLRLEENVVCTVRLGLMQQCSVDGCDAAVYSWR
jgi:hypothetical protein